MQIERSADGSHKCWLTPEEYDTLLGAAANYRDSLIIRLGGEVGLRSFEIPQIEPRHVKDVDGHSRLRVPEGKDTRDGVGKPRDAYLPESVERELLRYANVEGIERDEAVIDVTPRQVQRRVAKTAESVAADGGSDDWVFVSSHDLRRYYAQTLLVRERVNPRVVMQVGGWSSFSAIEPYLNAPTPGVVNDEFEGVELA